MRKRQNDERGRLFTHLTAVFSKQEWECSMSGTSTPSMRRSLTLSVLAAGALFYLPLHLAGIGESLLSGPAAGVATPVAATFAIPIALAFALYMPLLLNPSTYLWLGVVMEGLVVTALLWGRPGRVSRLLLVLIALAIPTAPWVFSYHPAVAPAPGYRMAVLTQPEPLEGLLKHAQMWVEIVPASYTLMGWDGEEALYYSEKTKTGSEQLWAFRPGEETAPRLATEIPSGLREGARVSVLDRVRAPGTFRPEDEPSVRAAHVRGSGLESPSGRWVAAITKWVYGPEDVVVLSKE